MGSVSVIIPTTGASFLREAVASVRAQTCGDVRICLVVDGPEFVEPARAAIEGVDMAGVGVCVLPENVGRDGFYGHRVYAAFSHLVNTDYVSFLDQDNWFEPDHLENLVRAIEQHGWDWAFALRRVVSQEGAPLIRDESQSIGPWGAPSRQFIDTNCYCLKTPVAGRVASHWHGGWGQDRVFYAELSKAFPNFGCAGRYTVNYRTRPDLQPRVMALLRQENAATQARHPDGLPWLAA